MHAARALIAQGITGELTMLDGNTGIPRTIINIEQAGQLTVSEKSRDGLRFRKWRGNPDNQTTALKVSVSTEGEGKQLVRALVRGVRHEKKDKGRIPGQFVPLLHEMMDCPAYIAMSHGAKCLYHALKRRAPRTNNRAYLSYRMARRELKASFNKVKEWFDCDGWPRSASEPPK